MDKKLQLEALKALMDGVKAKLLLFSGGFGGSFVILLKSDNLFVLYGLGFASAVLFSGTLINLLRLNKILNDIEKLKNDG